MKLEKLPDRAMAHAPKSLLPPLLCCLFASLVHFTDAAGVPGSWTIETDKYLTKTAAGWVETTNQTLISTNKAVRFIHPINTDKEGSIVAARLASALGGLGKLATSDSRRDWLTPASPGLASSTYVDDVARVIVQDLYGTVGQHYQNPMLNSGTIVFTSMHRYALYLAEALHAPVLPLQFISFANDWQQVKDAAQSSTIIVGQDGGFSGFWLWNKIAAGAKGTKASSLPPDYFQALRRAKNVVIVQPCDNWGYCDNCDKATANDLIIETYDGASAPVFIHSSLASHGTGAGKVLYDAAAAAGLIGKPTRDQVKNLKQWEYGVPDTTIENMRQIWTQNLKRDPAKFRVVSDGLVLLYAKTASLWQDYLTANNVGVRGFHWNSYWIGHSQLERRGAILPFPSYAYKVVWGPTLADSWGPVNDAAQALLSSLAGSSKDLSRYARNSRAYVNSIGSYDDPKHVKNIMTEYNLTQANGAFYGNGVDCSDAAGSWTGWNGEPTEAAYLNTAGALMDSTKTPYASKTWKSLGFDTFANSAVPAVCPPGLAAY